MNRPEHAACELPEVKSAPSPWPFKVFLSWENLRFLVDPASVLADIESFEVNMLNTKPEVYLQSGGHVNHVHHGDM